MCVVCMGVMVGAFSVSSINMLNVMELKVLEKYFLIAPNVVTSVVYPQVCVT